MSTTLARTWASSAAKAIRWLSRHSLAGVGKKVGSRTARTKAGSGLGRLPAAGQPEHAAASSSVPADLPGTRVLGGQLCPALPRARNHTKLLQQAKPVRVHPFFDGLAVDKMGYAQPGKCDVLASGWNA